MTTNSPSIEEILHLFQLEVESWNIGEPTHKTLTLDEATQAIKQLLLDQKLQDAKKYKEHYTQLINEARIAELEAFDTGRHYGKDYQDSLDELDEYKHKRLSTLKEARQGGDVLKTSKEWHDELCPDTQILDPDGWDRKNWSYSFFKEKVTEAEFNRRLMMSTVSMRPPTKPHNTRKEKI